MTDKSYRVKRGQRVDLHLPPGSIEDRPMGAGIDRKRFVGAEDEGEQMYFKQKGNITFFDLGVKKVDGEFQYISLGHVPAMGDTTAMRQAVANLWNAAMVRSTFENSWPFPQNSEFLFVDMRLGKIEELEEGEDSTTKFILIGDANRRALLNAIPAVGDPDPPLVDSTLWKRASVTFRDAGDWSLAIETAFCYNTLQSFVAADDEFAGVKITQIADSSGDAVVDFHIQGTDKLQIYLTPRLYIANIGSLGSDEEWWLARFPLLPFSDVSGYSTVTGIRGFDFGGLATGKATTGWWARIIEYLSAIHADDYGSMTQILDFLGSGGLFQPFSGPTPVLLGIIVRNSEAFYVWRTKYFVGVDWEQSKTTSPSS